MAERKTYEELTFCDDFMFCKVLQNNPQVCRELTLHMKCRKKLQSTVIRSACRKEDTAAPGS